MTESHFCKGFRHETFHTLSIACFMCSLLKTPCRWRLFTRSAFVEPELRHAILDKVLEDMLRKKRLRIVERVTVRSVMRMNRTQSFFMAVVEPEEG